VVVSSGYDPGSSAVTVRAFVTGIDSGSATCTLTLTGGSASARAQAQAQPDAKTMDCGTLAVPRAQLAPGTWTGTVAYSAPSRHGTSAAFTVQVPA
jgi:hypothetical protein